MFDLLCKSHGYDTAVDICQTSLEKPLLTVRANTIKTSRKALMKDFSNYNFNVTPCKFSQNGIRFNQAPEESLFKLVEFRRGHFEIQDEASQMLAMRVDAKPKQTVLDYCGGSGGKSLAFAPSPLSIK